MSFAILAGCEDPAVEVASLGKKLSAPTLKSASPFDQTFDGNNYVHMSGICDNRVGDLSVSFVIGTNNSTTTGTTTSSGPTAAQIAAAAMYHSPALSSDISGTTLQTTPTNDINCADGVFDFYITKKDIASIWGFDASDDSIDVSQIMMKGSTLIGDTQVLVMTDKNSNGGSSNIATKIVLEKQWPRGLAGGGRCESFNVFLTDGNGNYATNSTATSFTINKGIAGSTGPVGGYLTWSDCNNAVSGASSAIPVSTFTLPAGQNSMQVIVIMPSTGYDSTFTYQAASANLASGAADSVLLRDPSSTRTWVAVDPNTSHKIHKDICYPLGFDQYSYSGGYYAGSSQVVVTPTAANTNLKFYSDASCGTAITEFNIASGNYHAGVYVKYVSVASDSSDERIKVGLTTDKPANIDAASFILEVDKTGSATVSQLDMWGPNEIQRGTCNAYMGILANNHFAPIPATTDVTVGLTTTATGSFYSDSYCTTTISSLAFSPGQWNKLYYFKTETNVTPQSYSLNLYSSGLTSMSRSLKVNAGPAISYSINIMHSPQSLATGQCTEIALYTSESSGELVAQLPVNVTIATTGLADLSTVKFYTDASCANPISNSVATAIQPYNSNSYRLYALSTNTNYSETSVGLSLMVGFGSGGAQTQSFALPLSH
ncbi:hypothetical protein DOE51_02775 [Bdellovibrio sp. NC01]|nr:hypothetical protein DOE51_02775 [Bdellovibrio sp. NC01]